MERVQLTDRNVPRMKRRLGTIAGPRSCSSMILGLDSSRTLLILFFHGVKRENTAPLAARPTHGQTLDGSEYAAMAECVRSVGNARLRRGWCTSIGRTQQASRALFGRTSFTGPFVQFVHGLAAMRSAQTYLRII